MEYNWGDLITLEYGKPVKDKSSKDGSVPVYGTNGQIGTSHLAPLCAFPSVILGRKGAYREVHYSSVPFSVIDTGFYVKPLSSDVYMKWLYYKFKTYDINAMNSGSAIPSTDRYEIYKIPVSLPSLPEQKAVADTLSILDRNIELNNQANKVLEEMAQAIFKSWFVDFEPFGGEMPEDWEMGKIGDYVDVKSGFAFKSKWWTESGVKVIKIKNIENSGLMIDDVSFVAEDKIQLAEKFLANAGDVVIAMTGATLGKFCLIPYINEPLLINQRVGKFFLGDNPIEKAPFLWCLLKHPEIYSEIVNRGQGSAQPNISGTDIKTVEIVLPSEEYLENFNSLLQPLFEIMLRNSQENQTLTEIRNTLLPKLMSGEVRMTIDKEGKL